MVGVRGLGMAEQVQSVGVDEGRTLESPGRRTGLETVEQVVWLGRNLRSMLKSRQNMILE